MGNERGLADALTQALRHTPIAAADIDAMVAVAQRLQEKGLRPKRVFPKGLPAVDGTWLEYEVGPDLVPEFVNLLALEERLEELRLASIGVPVPDAIMVRVGLR